VDGGPSGEPWLLTQLGVCILIRNNYFVEFVMKFFKELNLILNWSFVFYLTMFGYRIINPFLAKFRSQIRAKGWKMKSPKEKIDLGFWLRFLGTKGWTYWKISAQSGVISLSRPIAITIGVLSRPRRVLTRLSWFAIDRSMSRICGLFCSASGSSDGGSKT